MLVWAQASVWNLLFWAIVLLTYIISPHGEVYLLEKCCYVFAQYDALHYLVSAPLLRGKLRCQLKLLKKVWIYSNNLWCVLDGAESTQQRRHVSLYTFRWWCLVEIICISIQTSIHRLHLNTIVITQEFLFLDLSHKQLRQDTTIEAANGSSI